VQSTIGPRELRDWQAFFRIFPPEYHADYRAGLIASTFANAFRKKNSRAYKPIDFMPARYQQHKDDPKVLSTKIRGAFQQIAARMKASGKS
jgi:hypothetical protein